MFSHKHWSVCLSALLLSCGLAPAWGGSHSAPSKTQTTKLCQFGYAEWDEQSGQHKQIDPGCELKTLYPNADSIGLALAVVPDPRVPRYKRIYDLAIQAVEMGMLRDGFVLDRYYLPWNTSANVDPGASAVPEEGKSAREQTESEPEQRRKVRSKHDATLHPGTFGLLTFRCDGWRQDNCGFPGTSNQHSRATIRAIYLVTDIETRGISRHPFTCALSQVRRELNDSGVSDGECPPHGEMKRGTPEMSLLHFPDASCASANNLVVLGPDFSGALDSVRELTSQFKKSRPYRVSVSSPVR
jgi:hypothetical protein